MSRKDLVFSHATHATEEASCRRVPLVHPRLCRRIKLNCGESEYFAYQCMEYFWKESQGKNPWKYLPLKRSTGWLRQGGST